MTSQAVLAMALAMALAAPQSSPRPLPGAELSVHVRALEALPPLEEFLAQAGQHAASLRPQPLAGLLHPLLPLEPGRREAWAAQGLGPRSALTASVQGTQAWSCTDGVDPAKLGQALDTGLRELGTVTELRARGAVGKQASVEGQGQGQAGYLLQGKVACAAKGPGAGKLLQSQVGLLTRGSTGGPWAQAALLEGDVVLVTSRGVAAVRARGESLLLDAQSHALPLPSFGAAGPSPYTLPKAPRLFTARARLSPSGLDTAMAQTRTQLRTLCPQCPAAPVLDAVWKELTGNVLVHVSSARPRNGLRTAADRYFSVRHALLLEVKEPRRVGALLEKAKAWPGVAGQSEGVRLEVPGGVVEVVLRGAQLAFSNDAEALAGAFSTLTPAPSPLRNGAEWASEGPALGRALGSVSLFDVMAEPGLAPLLGAALEFRSLLLATTTLEGTVDGAPGGAVGGKGPWQRLRARWTLAKSRAVTGGGGPDIEPAP